MPRRPQITTDLRDSVYSAISRPVCTRCQSRTDWHPTDCDKNGCHDLYAQEVEAVMEIFKQELAARCPQVTGDKPACPPKKPENERQQEKDND